MQSSRLELKVGTFVENLGADNPDAFLWHGHPGRIDDVVTAYSPGEYLIEFVGGPTVMSLPRGVREIDAATFASRCDRVLQGRHPAADRTIGLLGDVLRERPEGETPA